MGSAANLRVIIISAWVFAAVLISAPGRAEEITLQDGEKVAGTIVGFEDGMFKVETEFGFALIRRDKVKSISFPAGSKARPEALNTAGAPSKPPAALPVPEPIVDVPKAPPAPPPLASRPVDQPLPPDIRARLEGTTYINETFAFSFFKPLGWKIHEDAPRETGRAIVAVGPEDEHTILFVERQGWSGEPDLQSDATETNLRATYQNYRKVSESKTEVDGHAAIRKEFEGELDGALWRGVALRVAREKVVFGVIGLTSAETLQFHEAVLNKILKSFRFTSGSESIPSKPAGQ